MKSVITEALILRTNDYGESDRIVRFMSPGLGKVSGIAKGARKSIKRFGGCLEPFTLVSLTVQPREGLSLIKEGAAAKGYKGIKNDLERFAYGSYLLDLTNNIVADDLDDESEKVFFLLKNALALLEASDKPEEVVREYEVRLLGITGYMPSFLNCLSCGDPVDRPMDEAGQGGPVEAVFSPGDGGVFCRNCGSEKAGLESISIGTLKTLEAVSTKKVSFSRNAIEESGRIIPPFIMHHLGRRLKSLEFIDKMKGGV
ncbi:MAG: DNA repair protein RecO [Proteobacteria bacterium]|nr:DNA repair protein RecO [Pseudomonadota bacterium]